ncbi:hypothetical protein KC19_8G125900 [Ceratodon purpureus]|uniref:Glycosyltransferase n=1 Tax=Ceratodon purpureus TaxID=3225 RepID=A0A8T0GXW6_CERPU|nr:hypothetical protein KC19_8G125900 [Ceratodon purpureus]
MGPHVVMMPIFPAGHFTPFLIFAKRLASAGVTVTIVSIDVHIAEVKLREQAAEFLRFVELRDGFEHLSVELLEEWKTDAGKAKASRLLVEAVRDMSSPNAQALRGVPTVDFPVCVMHDMVTCWAQDAAEELGVEKHMLYLSPVGTLSIGLQSERLVREGRAPVTPENQDIPITDIPGLPPLQPGDLHSMYQTVESFEWAKYHEHRNRKADVIVANSFYDLEKHVIDAIRNKVMGTPGVQTIYLLDVGPLLPQSPTPTALEEKDPCILWLNTQKPASVLYVCFGSHSTHHAPQLLELASGLEASGQPFLWILRPPNSVHIDASALAAPIPPMTQYLPPGFEERIKGRGMCYSSWAPQRRILEHVSTGGFLSHCGWNSTLEGVCAGVPMLTWPFWLDQNFISRFLVDTAKLAIEVKREPIDPEQDLGEYDRIFRRVKRSEIEKQVRRLMQEEEGRIVRENMQNMKRNVERAVALGGSSRTNFEKYVQLLRAKASAAAFNGVNKLDGIA